MTPSSSSGTAPALAAVRHEKTPAPPARYRGSWPCGAACGAPPAYYAPTDARAALKVALGRITAFTLALSSL